MVGKDYKITWSHFLTIVKGSKREGWKNPSLFEMTKVKERCEITD